MLRIELTSTAPPEWEPLWKEDPRATLYLHPRWMKTLVRAFPQYRPRYLTAREDTRLAGLIPLVFLRRLGLNQFLSLPFGAHGGPVLHPQAPPETASRLAGAFFDLGKRWRTMRFEMTLFDPSRAMRDAAGISGPARVREWSSHLLDLEGGADAVWANYRRGTRKCVRAAERAEVRVDIERSPEALEILHRLHVEQGRAWAGVDPYPLRALAEVLEEMEDSARVFVARRGERPLAACLCLEHEGEIHPWVSGAAPEARPVRAFHLLMHTAIFDALNRGFRTWHFGSSGGNPDIEFFKESFGARTVPVLRCWYLAPWVRRLRRRPAWD